MFRPGASTTQQPMLMRSPQPQFTLDSVFTNSNLNVNTDFSDLQLRVPNTYNPTIDGNIVYSRGFTTNQAIWANLSNTPYFNFDNRNISQTPVLNNNIDNNNIDNNNIDNNNIDNNNVSSNKEMTEEEYYAMTYAVDEVDSGIPMDDESENDSTTSTITIDDEFVRLQKLAIQTMRSGGHDHWFDVDPKVREEFELKFEQLLLSKEKELLESQLNVSNSQSTNNSTSTESVNDVYDFDSSQLSEFLIQLNDIAHNLNVDEIRYLILMFIKSASAEDMVKLLEFLKRLPSDRVQSVLESLKTEVDHFTRYSEEHLNRLSRILSELSQQQTNMVEFTEMSFFSDLVLKIVVLLKSIITNIWKYFY